MSVGETAASGLARSPRLRGRLAGRGRPASSRRGFLFLRRIGLFRRRVYPNPGTID